MNKFILTCILISISGLASAQNDPKERRDELYYLENYPRQDLFNLLGSWEQKFIREGGRTNHDSPQMVNLTFQGDGQFFYNDSVIEKIEFLNKIGETTTRPIIHEIALEGTYRIDRDKLYLDFNTQSAADIEALSLSLGFQARSRQVVIQINRQKQFLVLRELTSSKQIFFQKTF